MVNHDEILEALRARKTWEDRIGTWYQMRHDGLRRVNKPWKGAADMHFPLADMQIEKLKPYYVEQVYAGELFATFRGNSAQANAYAAANAQWFHHQLTTNTNFEKQILRVIDGKLQNGRTVMKVFWDPIRKQLRFQAINPLYIIVPPWTDELAEADWIVHVKHYSLAAYKRARLYKTDEETIKKITGATSEMPSQDEKYEREGITKPTGDKALIVWEVWERKEAAYEVSTYSPVNPEVLLRDSFRCPYDKGAFGVSPRAPFVEFSAEEMEEGYYSPRGVPEKVAPFEASLGKDWNTIKDYQTLTCQPVFRPANGATLNNTANLTMAPGKVFTVPVEAIQFPAIPVDLWNGMQQTRAVAEQLLAMPDFGTGQVAAPQGKKTATEANIIAGVFGQGVGMKARIFRRELGDLYKLSWAILLQYGHDSLDYYYRDTLTALDRNALTDAYQVEPTGSADNINRQLVLQKAQARKQMFSGSPYINQAELDKSVLEADDPRLVGRLFIEAGAQKADQIEDQAQELSIMLMGFAPLVRPSDDDQSHLQSMVGFVQRRIQMGEPLVPEVLMLIANHGQQHLDQMKRKTPQVFAQQGGQFSTWLQEIRRFAQPQQQQQPQPQLPPQ